MDVCLKTRDSKVYAEGIYDFKTGTIIVKKGACVAASVKSSATFANGAKRIVELRKDKIKDNVLQSDMNFTSLSAAASFILGTSSNGLLRWKDVNGISIQKMKKGIDK